MAAFERKGPLKLEAQLDGSASEAFDCGVAACVVALDDASYGLIRPSTEAVRKRMGNDRDATNPDQWKAAIDSYADHFLSIGLQPPRTSVVRGKGHDELWRLLHDQRRRVIGAIGYGTVASEKRSLWASRSFRGNHAVYLRGATLVDGARKVPTYDPLADGRFKGCPNGRRLWPFWLIRAASGDVRDGGGRRLGPRAPRVRHRSGFSSRLEADTRTSISGLQDQGALQPAAVNLARRRTTGQVPPAIPARGGGAGVSPFRRNPSRLTRICAGPCAEPVAALGPALTRGTHRALTWAPGDPVACCTRGRVSRSWSISAKAGHLSRARLAAEERAAVPFPRLVLAAHVPTGQVRLPGGHRSILPSAR